MVNFEDSTTVATPPHDILRILVLQRRDSVLDAIEHYDRALLRSTALPLDLVRARIKALYEDVREPLEKSINKDDLEKIKAALKKKEYDLLYDAWGIISRFLYDKKLTQWDAKVQYDSTRAEYENRLKGLT